MLWMNSGHMKAVEKRAWEECKTCQTKTFTSRERPNVKQRKCHFVAVPHGSDVEEHFKRRTFKNKDLIKPHFPSERFLALKRHPRPSADEICFKFLCIRV